MFKLIKRLSFMLTANLSASLQMALMKIYGKFNEEGDYTPNRQIPELMVKFLQFLGKLATAEV